jgi:hypothetical protein
LNDAQMIVSRATAQSPHAVAVIHRLVGDARFRLAITRSASFPFNAAKRVVVASSALSQLPLKAPSATRFISDWLAWGIAAALFILALIAEPHINGAAIGGRA